VKGRVLKTTGESSTLEHPQPVALRDPCRWKKARIVSGSGDACTTATPRSILII